MAGQDESGTAAFAIMREWDWWGGDPDGNTWPLWKELSLVVNRLAMEGIADPQNALIALLCKGDLMANGDYCWEKYQWGNHYQHGEHDGDIKQRQWQILAELIEQERLEIKSGGFLLDHVELTRLSKGNAYPYECSFRDHRFNTALCPPDTPEHDGSYFEEWFSAWNISVRPAKLGLEFDGSETEVATPVNSKGGRRPAKWWPDFAEELAYYIYADGLPEGQGHDGQSVMIDTIFARMVEQGKAEPGRPTVQPVINAVLRRIRSAGN